MICTLLTVSIISTSAVSIGDALEARERDYYRAVSDVIASGSVQVGENYTQTVRLIADDGVVALIELPDGTRMFTRAQHDLEDCHEHD
tara:strand:- start:1005 stop:1268 length:264 start_codon:yes stop_codon:yes gene_type:complete